MLSPLLVPPVPPISSRFTCFFEDGLPPTTHSCLPALAFPYIGASSLYRTKGLSSH